MSIFENAADLLHELKVAAGTVLTILGSKLEADARARVECGPQWLTEFEEQRDSLEPSEVCAFHGEWCAGEASWCTRQCNKCDEAVYWHRDVEAWFHCAGVNDRRPCPYGDGPVVEHSSAATPHAADPSPAVRSPYPASAGGEGPGGASDIPQSAPPGQPTCAWCNRPESDDPACCADGRDWRRRWEQARSKPSPVPAVVAGGSPREEDEQPSLGEPAEAEDADELAYPFCCYEPAEVTHEDLAAHLIGAAIRANTGHVDVLVEAFASSLLTDFNITKK